MPIVPPTPFLPISKYQLEDQTLLIGSQPIYDDSLDSSPDSPISHWRGDDGAGPSKGGYNSLEVVEDNQISQMAQAVDEGNGGRETLAESTVWGRSASTVLKRVIGDTPSAPTPRKRVSTHVQYVQSPVCPISPPIFIGL